MSCLDATIERLPVGFDMEALRMSVSMTMDVQRLPIELDMEALRISTSMTMNAQRLRPELLFSASVVCGVSLGTTQVLYSQDGLLVTVDGEKIIVPR